MKIPINVRCKCIANFATSTRLILAKFASPRENQNELEFLLNKSNFVILFAVLFSNRLFLPERSVSSLVYILVHALEN